MADTGIQSFFEALLAARPRFLQQQEGLLGQLGAPLRQALFNASPELALTSNYLQSQFANPLPPDLAQDYAERIRTAQAARGFGGGGTGPAGEEARFLLGAADQRRMQLLPQLQGFGANILGMAGLQAPPNLDFASIASAMLGSRRLDEEISAGQSQSRFAQQMYNDMLRGRLPGGGGGGGMGGGGSGQAYAGSSSYLGGGGTGYGYNAYQPSLNIGETFTSSMIGGQGGWDPFSAGAGAAANQAILSGAFGGYHAGTPAGQLPPSQSFSSVTPAAANDNIAGANWAGTGKSYRELHPWNYS